jgi:cysteinyl-tRNA synthetase
MDLSWNSIQSAHFILQRWRKSYQDWRNSPANYSDSVANLVAEVSGLFNDDLDTPKAMILLRGVERADLSPGEKRAIYEKLDSLFGLNLLLPLQQKGLSSEAQKLLEKRELAREERDFELSDKLRDELLQLGIEVRDTSEGQEWGWKIS